MKLKDFEKFVAENCKLCGSQRCNPYDPFWLEGCTLYKELKEKEKMSKEKYKFYTDGSNKMVAVSTYAGKTVRGVAKCDPRDTFDVEVGQNLAIARCAMKIANKRYARAQHEFEKAEQEVAKALARLDKMTNYVNDAQIEVSDAQKRLEAIFTTV